MHQTNFALSLIAGTTLTVFVGLLGVYAYKTFTQAKKKFRQVGKIEKIYLYPVKSCRGIEVEAADAEEIGLRCGKLRDRHWMVVDAKGLMVTSRKCTKMLLVTPSLHGDYLHLDMNEMETLKLPIHMSPPSDDSIKHIDVWKTWADGADCGEEAANWISNSLGKPGYRIVCFLPEFRPRFLHESQFVKDKRMCQPKDKCAYHDCGSILVMVKESIEDLESRVGDREVSHVRYRPNILISGCKALDEENWDRFRIGDVEGRSIMQCPRCVVPSFNPETGKKDSDNKTREVLESYRRAKTSREVWLYDEKNALFGIFVSVDTVGQIRLNDPIMVTYK